MAKKHVPFVIAYDFDGTLSPGNMQEYDFVPALGIKPADFWREAKAMAQEQQADEILAYMRLMIERANTAKVSVRKKNFADFGAHIQLFPGVQDWFKRITEYGRTKGVKVEHFIISSGLREMIEGTPINKYFMRLVKNQGGHSIAVYGKGKRGARDKALKLVKEGRTNLATTADYTDGSAIDRAVKAMIDKVVADRTIAEANG